MVLPVVQLPDSRFTELGSFQVSKSLAVGEEFERTFDDAAGRWKARWIATETIDALFAEVEGEPDYDDPRFGQQLQLYLDDSDPSELLSSLTYTCNLPVHAAWFRAGDASLKSIIQDQSAQGPLFDGVEGLIGGAGVAVYLGGDGGAEVHVAQTEFGPELIHINLV